MDVSSVNFPRNLRSWIPTSWHYRRDDQLPSSRTSLMRLPDDILFLILDQLYTPIHTSCAVWNEPKVSWEALVALSLTNKRMRSLVAPKMFRTVTFGRSWSVGRLLGVLTTMSSFTEAFKSTKHFRIDLWPDRNAVRTTLLVKPDRDEVLVAGKRLVELLSQMERLEKLEMTMPIGIAATMKMVFQHNASVFPHVKELILGTDLQWMIPMCPSVHKIRTNDWISYTSSRDVEYAFIEAAAAMHYLRHFSMHCQWDSDLVQRVSRAMPGLRGLGMPGSIAEELWCNPKQCFDLLSSLMCLERLELRDIHKWANGMAATDPSSWYSLNSEAGLCGLNRDQELVAKCVFKMMPSLKELDLGERFQAVISPVMTKQLSVQWEMTVSSDDVWGRTHVAA